MSFSRVWVSTFGFISNFIVNSPKPVLLFSDPGEAVLDDSVFEFETITGTLTGNIPIDIEETIFKKLKFSYDRAGSKDLEFELNQFPYFPLLRFTKVALSLGGVRAFGGYIYKTPKQGSRYDRELKYSGLGLNKRFKKMKIAPRINRWIYEIDKITKSGSNIIVTLSESLDPLVLSGSICYIRGAEEDINNGRYTIGSTSVNTITVPNVAGLNQTIIKGSVYVLPQVMSNPTALVSELIKFMVTEYFSLVPFIKNIDTFISETTGVFIGSRVDFQDMDYEEAFERLQSMAVGYRLWVDPMGVIRLDPESSQPIDSIFSGFGPSMEFDENLDEIVNIVTVKGIADKSGGKIGGFAIKAIARDETSILRNGPMEKEIEVSASWGDEAMQTVADQVLNSYKEGVTTAEVDKAPFGYYAIGKYTLVSSEDFYTDVIDEMDSLDGWEADVEITASLSSSILVTGSHSIRLQFNSDADGAEFKKDVSLEIPGLRKMIFYLRSNKVGTFLKFGLGTTDFTENLYTIPIGQSADLEQYVVEVPISPNSTIGQIGFLIDGSEDLSDVFIDEISFEYYTALHIQIDLKQVDVIINPHDRYCKLHFGIIYQGLDNFMANLSAIQARQSVALRDK